MVEKMVDAFKTRSIESAIEGLVVEQNDEITNQVREYLDTLSEKELLEIRTFLNKLLNYCYDGKIYDEVLDDVEYSMIEALTDKEKFLLKESIIYFGGRLAIPCDLYSFKRAYNIDENKYIRLNLTFATLSTFDEEIEMDFVNKVLLDEEYDNMLRSWTMAFFKGVRKPYEYVDMPEDDWTLAKLPRIKRLSINDVDNPKYKKAMAFRLLDLVVLYLFINNRKVNTLTEEEKQIVENANIDYEKYSEDKKAKMLELKRNILN